MKNYLFFSSFLFLIFIQEPYAQSTIGLNGFKIFVSKQYPTTLYFHDKYTAHRFGENNCPYTINALFSDEKQIAIQVSNEVKEPYTFYVTEGGRKHRFIILYKEQLEASERDVNFTDTKELDKLIKDLNNTSPEQITITPATRQPVADSNKESSNAISLITEADNLKKTGHLEDAEKKYEEAVQIQPDNDYAQAGLSEVKKLIASREAGKFSDIITKANNASAANNLNEALSLYTEALKLKNDDIFINSQIQSIQNKLKAAKIEEATRRTDSLFESYINTGDKALKDTLYNISKIAYNEALNIKPGSPVALLRIQTVNGKIYSDSINAALEKNKTLYLSYLNAGDKALEEKSYEQAKFAYKEALKTKPNDVDATAKLNAVDAKIMADYRQVEQLKKDSLYKVYIVSSDKAFKDSSYDVAKAGYDSALNIKSGDNYASSQIKKIDDNIIAQQQQAEKNLELQKNLERQSEYKSLIDLADRDYNAGNYAEAKNTYFKALLINKNDSYSKNKINQITKIFNDLVAKQKRDSTDNIKYKNNITKADKAYASKDYAIARQSYTDALKYKDDEYPKNKLVEINETLAELGAIKQAAADSVLKQKQINKNYTDLITTAKTAYNQTDYTTARVMYVSAAELKPFEAEPKLKLAKIDSEQAEIAAKKIIQDKLDSLKTNGEIALASNEFPLALDNFSAALELNNPDEDHYLKMQISYIQNQLKVAEQQRKDEEVKQNLDSAVSAYRQGKDSLNYKSYEGALLYFKKFLSIINSMDSATLSNSGYNLNSVINYVRKVIPNLEASIINSKTVSIKKDSLPAVAKVYGFYAPMLYYPNPKDPNLNYVYKKYPDLNLNASPPDQHFDSLLNYSIENNLIGREIMSLKPDLELSDSSNNVLVVCQNIKFNGAKVYYKFLIQNRDTTEFLTGRMLLSNYKSNGDTVKLYPNYVANYPVILPGRQKVIVYVTRAVAVADEEQLNFSLFDRLNKYKFSINIPGTIYNQEKQH